MNVIGIDGRIRGTAARVRNRQTRGSRKHRTDLDAARTFARDVQQGEYGADEAQGGEDAGAETSA